ncbi:MAG: lysine--tRNA ligase [Tractidigestivibacter sp.]|jgi:lysyl-tRNA synthetase class 2|uniref:lysine--tRNA ligase n=1 Tax=Tractidigestivibacter sp. TaxID=2847320 RepID=UPI003D8ED296
MSDQNARPTDERTQRRARRQALINEGVNPYPINSTVTAHAAELEEKYASLEDGGSTDDVVSVAGRIRALRRQGKVAFVVVEDVSGQIQLFCRKGVLDDASWNLVSQLDLGDIVDATGAVIRTRRGQLSVSPTTLTMLSKSLRPLPEKFHGLTDREIRYRQRYLDLIMNPDVRETFRKRSQIISTIRRYMESQGYLEVETPMMHQILGGANAKPFVTHFNALDCDFYLRIATELPLKRLIVGGMERVFEIGRQFRNEGMDLTHNPEFTSMEAYCAYSNLQGMKELTQSLFQTIARECCGCEPGHEVITYQGQTVDMSGTWRSVSLSDVASEVVGEHIDMDTPVEHLRELCQANGIEWQEGWGAGKLLFELYDELGEKTIVDPTFVCDYPEEVSPLSKRKDEDPRLTDRFELVICGNEYANAFSELNDPVDQAGRFAEQVAAKDFDDEAMGYDYDYVRALEYGMPPAGGIGYGIDRMIMLFCDQASIRDVLLFPQMKPEHITKADIASQLPDSTDNAAASVDAIVADAEAGASAEASPETKRLESGLTRDQAFDLLKKYNEDPFHIQHGETLEGLMRYYAEKYDPENVDFWGQVGLLHDLDWEKFQDPVQHTVKAGELIREAGGSEELVHAIQTHNSDNNPDLPAPESKMECVLYACDELSGLIQAAILMRPSKSVMDFEVKSLKKKFKDKRFAAGCSRDVIRHGAELNDMELDELFASVIEAMKAIAPDRDEWLASHPE